VRMPWLYRRSPGWHTAGVSRAFCVSVDTACHECMQVRLAGRRAVVATPRVLKPEEERLVQFYLRLQADALLLRSAGMMQQLLALGGPGERPWTAQPWTPPPRAG
jgi:hypothetical protein